MTFLPKWWRRKFLLIELCLAVVLTVLFVVWYLLLGGETTLCSFLEGNRSSIYGTAASIFGSLLGFSITATSIVLGFSTSDRLKILRDSKQFKTLWMVFSSSIWALSLATTTSFLALIFDRDSHHVFFLLVAAFFGAILSLLRLARTIWVLENIITIITMPSKQSEGNDPPA
ncbi:MAG: hypothetical protein PHI97_29105 [Desulfobulbus sp.]|jgi:hypothetical protein|nr:hypothetical protein [Desulfobulbus sp.]